MAEYSPRQITHAAKGPIYCKIPSDVPHHHFNVAVVHAPEETPADHQESYHLLQKEANEHPSVNFDATRTLQRINLIHGKLRKVPEVERHTDRDLMRAVRKIMRQVSHTCMRWSNVTVSYPLRQIKEPEEMGKILASRFNCRLNPTEMAALYAQLDWRQTRDVTIGEILTFVAQIIDVDKQVGKNAAKNDAPASLFWQVETHPNHSSGLRKKRQSAQNDESDDDNSVESIGDGNEMIAEKEEKDGKGVQEFVLPNSPVKNLLESDGARDPTMSGSNVVYFQADVRIHNIVKDATDGGNIRTALTKVVAAAAAYERKYDGPHLLLGYKGTEISREIFHATLLKILHIELTEVEKEDLDQYYSLHHVVHWHHMMGTSKAMENSFNFDSHARLPVRKIDWHFFVKDFMAWCSSSTDWYNENKKKKSRNGGNQKSTGLRLVPKIERFASTVTSRYHHVNEGIFQMSEAESKSGSAAGAAGMVKQRKRHEKFGQKHLLKLQRAILQARLLRDKHQESRLLIQLFHATELMIIPQDIKDELHEAMAKRLQDEERVMLQALGETHVRMWGMDAKLRSMKSSTTADNARLAASTLARGSQRKTRAAIENELEEEEAKEEGVRKKEITELHNCRLVGDGIMRIAQYRIFHRGDGVSLIEKRRSVQNLTKWRNIGKQYRKDMLVKIAALKFKHMGQRRCSRQVFKERRQTNAALVIQTASQDFLTRKRVQKKKEKQKQMDRDLSATKIQHCYRRYRTYQIKKFNQRKMASESGRRSHLKRSLTVTDPPPTSTNFFVTHLLKVQSKVRGYLAKKKVDSMRTARIAIFATKIQMRIRSIRLNRRVRERQEIRKMSTMIQKSTRRIQAKRLLKSKQMKSLNLFRISIEFAEKLASPEKKNICDAYAVLTIITTTMYQDKELIIEKTTPVIHQSESPEWNCAFENRRFALNDKTVVLVTIFDDRPFRDPVCLGQIRLDSADGENGVGFLDQVKSADEVYKRSFALKKPDLRYKVKGVHKQDPSSRKLTVTGSVTIAIQQEPPIDSQCGWLQRRVNRMAEVFVWKPCWAVLHNKQLVIYEGRTEERAVVPLQVIQLADVSGVSYNHRIDCFEIITFGVGRHFFKCHDNENFKVRRSWIRKLRRLSAQIPHNEFVSEEVTHDKYMSATKRLSRYLDISGVRIRSFEKVPRSNIGMKDGAILSSSPTKSPRWKAQGVSHTNHSYKKQVNAGQIAPSVSAGAKDSSDEVPKHGKDTVEVIKYALQINSMLTLNRKLRRSISDRGGYRYRYPVDSEGNAAGQISMPMDAHELMVIETQRRAKLTRESAELSKHVDLLHEYLSYTKASRPYFISKLSQDTQTIVHNLYENLSRLHSQFENLSPEERNRRMRELFPAQRKSLVLYQVMVAETFKMPASSMITPMGGRRGRGVKPVNSEPNMKAEKMHNRSIIATSPPEMNVEKSPTHKAMSMSTGKLITTPQAMICGQKLLDSPLGRDMENTDLALDLDTDHMG